MKLAIQTPKKALNKAFLKVKPNRNGIELFKSNFINLLDQINETESEEFHKNIVSKFLDNTYYCSNHYINTKGRNDLVVHNGKDAKSTVGVIIETKKPANKAEMLRTDNINAKAFQELLLYYLRERITYKNLELKYLIATNIYEWFIFDAQLFEKLFAQNKTLVKQFHDFEEGRMSGKTTDFFYKEIAEPVIAGIKSEIEFTFFSIKEYEKPLCNNDKADDNKLIALYKIFSPEHLLKLPFSNDSNSLDKSFYTELLHLIGLTETKEGSKKLIERKKEGERNSGSLLENVITQLESLDKIRRLDRPSQFGETHTEQLFNVGLELCITWVNRVLFLKLLEAQLITYHKGDKNFSFLNISKVKNYDDLNSLFFSVLAKLPKERDKELTKLFANVPYLNSSLFEPTEMEHQTLFISNLRDEMKLPVLNNSVLKNSEQLKKTTELSSLEYLFEFLNTYDFSSEGSEDIQEDNKALINASVLGLIFEKINGYKDGSFFTPGFITMYMCRETIRRSVLQKFNDIKKWNCTDFNQLYNKIENRKEANDIVNSIKICDPAVGSGHFLVSALNEIIAVKSELKILLDREGRRLKEYEIEVVNDELIITDEEGELFEYNPGNKESQRIQETLFHEKQTIIENCLFGVDINTNSVKICRLRLWIELLKNAYYKANKNYTELETLPNIDINIKCGNSLISRFALDADLKQALKKSKWTIDTYKLAVHTYRNAQNKEQKREMEKLINAIKNNFRIEIGGNDPKVIRKSKLGGELYNLIQAKLFEISNEEKKIQIKKQEKLEEQINRLTIEIEEIKSNKIYENAFEWRFEFPEVLNDEGDFIGFDVVIGNPPWGAELSTNALAYIKSENKDIVVRMVDTFMFFINLDFKIKNRSGLITQIVPDVLLYQIDNKKLREKILLKYQLLLAVNLGDNIFEDVARASSIVIIGSNQNNLTEVFEYRKSNSIRIEDINRKSINTDFLGKLPNKIFATRNFTGYTILSRLQENKLISLIDNDGIQRGISPDLKEAFIVDDSIIVSNNLESEFIFPTITGGRDTERYYSNDIGKRIIYTKKGDDESQIENIIKYISRFKKSITCKEVQQGKHPFWALHRARCPEIFNKNEKILGVITGDKIFVSDSS